MIKMMALSAVMAGLIAPMTILSSSESSQEIRDLTKRVEKLEQAKKETSKTLDKVSKKVSELEERLRLLGQQIPKNPSGSTDQSKADKGDKPVKELEKNTDRFSKAITELQKNADTEKKALLAMDKKYDDRTHQLAKWFDEYHPKRDSSYYHRDEVKRIK